MGRADPARWSLIPTAIVAVVGSAQDETKVCALRNTHATNLRGYKFFATLHKCTIIHTVNNASRDDLGPGEIARVESNLAIRKADDDAAFIVRLGWQP